MRTATTDSRAARGTTGAQSGDDPRSQAATGQELASALDKVAERLGSANGGADPESRKLSGQLARAQELKEQLNRTGQALEAMGRQNGPGGQARSPGRVDRRPPAKAAAPVKDSRAAADKTAPISTGFATSIVVSFQKRSDLVNEMRREDGSSGRGGAGATFAVPGNMTLAAPGTEAFKQDFANWESMRRRGDPGARKRRISSPPKKLQAKQSKERLAAGADDKALPAQYQQQRGLQLLQGHRRQEATVDAFRLSAALVAGGVVLAAGIAAVVFAGKDGRCRR